MLSHLHYIYNCSDNPDSQLDGTKENDKDKIRGNKDMI